MKNSNLLYLLLFFSVALSVSCLAQSGGGTIQGTIKDASGAVIPNAKLAIQNVETGVITSTTTNNDGYFSTPSLVIGKYKVRVEAAGMKSWETEIQLETGRTTELNAVMLLGQVSETVEVSAAVAPLITTTDPTDGSTLDSMRISELPVNGRDLHMLLQDVTPGVEAVEDVNGGVRVAGLMVYSTDFVQDGASSNNREFGGSMNLQGLDSIGEVRVETSTSSAKYTRPTSVVVTTKGGTNQIHGSMYETMRNNGFGVARARQDVNLNGAPYKTPKLIRNEFGGSIGGPVVLPSFGLNGKKWYNGRGHTFFFFSKEGQELRQGVTMDWKVPTMAQRQGNFSGLVNNLGQAITLYDPLTTARITANNRAVTTRLPFVGNVIPTQRESPLAKYIYGITPLPTDVTDPMATTNLRMAVPRTSYPNSTNNPTSVRIDHKVNEKDNFFLKTNWSNRLTNYLGTASGIGAPTLNSETNVTFLPMDAISGGLNWNHVFANTFFVETILNRTWQNTRTTNGAVQKDWAAQLGMPNPLGEIGFPAIRNVQFMTYLEGDNRRQLYSMVTNASQNYTLLKGTHNIQFGWSWHNEKQNLQPDQGDISGSSWYNSNATALESSTNGTTSNPGVVSLTGNEAANFFLGAAARIDVGLKRKLLRVVDRNFGLYVQDNYKVTSRLTITPGLRWDINPAMIDKDHLMNSFDVQNHSILLPEPLDYYYKKGYTTAGVVGVFQNVGVTFETAEDVGRSKNIFPANYFDLGPRVGFAYKALDGRKQFVIRGGYGIYISPIPMRTLLAQFSSMAPFRATFKYDPNASATSPDGNANWLLRNAPVYTSGVNSLDAVNMNSPVVGRGQSVTALAPDQPDMKIHEWNLALEKQIKSTMVVRIRYTGKHGVHADQLENINPQQTDYIWYVTQLRSTPSGAFSSVARRPYDQNAYTTVQLLQRTGFINSSVVSFELERRFSKGLGFQAFYTVTNAFRMAGNSFRDDVGSVSSNFLPGTVPADQAALNRFLYYDRDANVPKHRVRWNWNYELPFGRGKALGRNAPGWLNTAIGGWKLSGTGTILSQYYSMPTNNWGEMGRFQVYGKKYKILDCRSTPASATDPRDERCLPGYFYFNGYISVKQIGTYNAAGLRNGVFGLPADYVPAQKPVNPWPVGGKSGDPGYGDWDTNNVYIKLTSGSNQKVAYDTGLHPWRNQHLLGPFNWSMDSSLMKFFRLTERVRLRANVDLFNVLNRQGLVNPAADGIATLSTSYGGNGIRPRQLQGTMRLEW